MSKTPLYERIDNWLFEQPRTTTLLIHPDDVESKSGETSFRIIGRIIKRYELSVKILGQPTVYKYEDLAWLH